jgi:hypothetical protein
MSKQLSRQQTRLSQRRERREDSRRREQERQSARRRRNIIVASVIAAVIVVVLAIVIPNLINRSPNPSTANNSQSANNPLYPSVDNISCDTLEHTSFHVHAHLSIYINGAKVDLPQNLGIASDQTCLYWLHTHDATGVVHIEAPGDQTYKLGTLLKLWRDDFASLQYPNQLSATNGWTAYVDGKEVSNDDFNGIELKSHELITLAYNSPDIKADSMYNWPADLAQ